MKKAWKIYLFILGIGPLGAWAAENAENQEKFYVGASLAFSSNFISRYREVATPLNIGLELTSGITSRRFDWEFNMLHFNDNYSVANSSDAVSGPVPASYSINSYVSTLKWYLSPRDENYHVSLYLIGGAGAIIFQQQRQAHILPCWKAGFGLALLDYSLGQLRVEFFTLDGENFKLFGTTNIGFLYKFD